MKHTAIISCTNRSQALGLVSIVGMLIACRGNETSSPPGNTGNPTHASRSGRQLTDAQAANYTVKNSLNPWLPTYSQ